MKPIISSIAAVSKNNIIGNGPDIPWHIVGEQERFKLLTTGETIVMGRKTYESIGKPLPNRNTIVMTTQDIIIEGVTICNNVDSVLEYTKDLNQIFICGGQQIYEAFWDITTVLYLTTIEIEVDGDIYFPEVGDEYKTICSKYVKANINYIEQTLVKY